MQYETIFIVNPELDESEINQVIEGVKTTIESNGGKIFKVDPWGKRRLAYTVKRHNEGYYILLIFESEPEFVQQLSTYYQIAEPIIKHLIVRFEGDLPASPPDHTEEPQAEGVADSPDDSPLEDVESEDDNDDVSEDEEER